MKLFLISFIFLNGFFALAQEAEAPAAQDGTPVQEVPANTADSATKPAKPLGRFGVSNPPNESSSFIGDPNNIDPLYPNRDNLKEDAEPVLEDIKSVLDAPKKKKEKANGAAEGEINPPAPITMDTPIPSEPEKPSLAADDPDLILEKKFNEIFKRYNINPTPDDIWAAASSKQTARLYEVQKGDTLWSISKILFGDGNFWPKLWALNKQGILNPHFINPRMKIYFYEGDEEFAPTLSVGEKAKPVEESAPDPGPPMSAVQDGVQPSPATPGAAPAALGADEEPPAPKPVVRTGNARMKTKRAAPLPPSLPISRNELYYVGKKKIKQNLIIDIGKPPEFDIIPNNDIVVTDEIAKTEVEIQPTEVIKFRCNDGRLLKDIKFTGSLAPEYDIYERLEDLPTTTGIKYVYRLYGRAKPYQGKYLRVMECRSLIGTDLLLVQKDRMKEMNTRKISETPEATLIGGPALRDQRLFEKLTYGFVDFGGADFDRGQEYRTISQLTDRVNSQFQVVEKYGSYAVVFFTDVADMIEVGDKVVNK